MKRGFTLLELLLVIAIMAMMGTVSVGGYRAMQRGMAERGVMDNVNAFVRAAYQRAQIDRLPTAVYFWNETLRGDDSDDAVPIVVGKAVAVRRHGRLSGVEGTKLLDEFGDLERSYQTTDSANGDDASAEGGSASKDNSMYLYPMENLSKIESSGSLMRSVVGQKVVKTDSESPVYLSGTNGELPKKSEMNDDIQDGSDTSGKITVYAFDVIDAGGVDWEPGMAYGFEFAELELPHGYIFGNAYSTSMSTPIREAGTLVFDVGENQGSGTSSGTSGSTTINVCSLRPNSSGEVSAQSVGTSSDPSKDLN